LKEFYISSKYIFHSIPKPLAKETKTELTKRERKTKHKLHKTNNNSPEDGVVQSATINLHMCRYTATCPMQTSCSPVFDL